jgi:hypothetical protein
MQHRSQGDFVTERKKTLRTNWGAGIKQQSPQLNSYEARKVNSPPQDKEGLSQPNSKIVKGVKVHNVRTLSSEINGELNMDYRRKGLTYFTTFVSQISAQYQLKNESDEEVNTEFFFPLPTEESLVWNAAIEVNDSQGDTTVNEQGLTWEGSMSPQEEKQIIIKYSARGLDQFSYALNKSNGPQDLTMNLSINGAEKIDFPQGALSPSSIIERDNGWDLSWQFNKVLSSPSITVKMFAKQNISDQIARLFWFVPILLIGYILSLKGLAHLRQQRLTNFDYILLSALYTIFYPFLAYLVSVFAELNLFSGLALAFAAITPIVLYLQQYLFDLKFTLTKGILLQLIFTGFFPVALLIPELTGLLAIGGTIVLLAIIVQLRRVTGDKK